jgi:hypothetical protein
MLNILIKFMGLFIHQEVMDSFIKSGLSGSVNAAKKIRARRLKKLSSFFKKLA